MRLDKYDFYCPKCKSKLNDSGIIHLKTERQSGEVGDMYLSTTFGNYGYSHLPKIEFNPNELIEFLCPKCDSNLKSITKPEFVSMLMKVEHKFEFEILFSRKAGIQKTFVVTEDGIECYGKDA